MQHDRDGLGRVFGEEQQPRPGEVPSIIEEDMDGKVVSGVILRSPCVPSDRGAKGALVWRSADVEVRDAVWRENGRARSRADERGEGREGRQAEVGEASDGVGMVEHIDCARMRQWLEGGEVGFEIVRASYCWIGFAAEHALDPTKPIGWGAKQDGEPGVGSDGRRDDELRALLVPLEDDVREYAPVDSLLDCPRGRAEPDERWELGDLQDPVEDVRERCGVECHPRRRITVWTSAGHVVTSDEGLPALDVCQRKWEVTKNGVIVRCSTWNTSTTGRSFSAARVFIRAPPGSFGSSV